jgi:hypothetical protein
MRLLSYHSLPPDALFCPSVCSFLTHDSPAVRKQHNSGYKHKSNVKSYFLQFEGSGEGQDVIEQQIADFQRSRGGVRPTLQLWYILACAWRIAVLCWGCVAAVLRCAGLVAAACAFTMD